MRTTQPHPCLVSLVLVIITLVINYLMEQIGAGTVMLDMDALSNGNYAELIQFNFDDFTVVAGLLSLAFRIISVTLSFGFISYMLNVSRRQPSGVGDLFDGFVVFFRALWLNILMSVLIALQLCLLIVPGVIAAYKYSMAPYLLFDHPEWSAWRCIKESKSMMKGHKWQLFVLNLSFIGWYFLAAIPGVDVYVSPFTGLASAEFYRYLAGEGDFRQLPQNNREEKAPWEY